jgi:hypothetical protein
MLLACRLKITFTFSLKLIISILVQLHHLLLPSLIVTSSQVRVGMPLPLQSCCISCLGPKGLLHNRTIAVKLPVSSYFGWPLHPGKLCLQETFHVKLNGQNAVSIRCPTTLQYPLEKLETSLQELRSMRNSPRMHQQEPDFFFGSRVMHFSRDLSYSSTGSYVSCSQGSHMQEQYHQWTTLHTWNPNSCLKMWCPSGLTLRCMPYGRGMLRFPLRRFS